jgi:hypothetical protein
MQYRAVIATELMVVVGKLRRAMPLSSQGGRLRSCRILDTEMLAPPIPARPQRISLIFVLILAGCGSRPSADAPLFGTGMFHPPPKPGASISQTRMCECIACEPSSCCEGPEDDEPPPSCNTSSYVFDSRCEPSIRSCTSRCAREVWRVKSGEGCATRRPASCCRAG